MGAGLALEFRLRIPEMYEIYKQKCEKDEIKIGEIARPDILPIIDDKPIPIYQLEEQVQSGKVTEVDAKKIIKKYNDHQQELQLLFKKGLKLSQELKEKLVQLEVESSEKNVKGVIENLKEKYNSPETKILPLNFWQHAF